MEKLGDRGSEVACLTLDHSMEADGVMGHCDTNPSNPDGAGVLLSMAR